MGATTYFDIGSSSYFETRINADLKADLELEIGFVGKGEGQKGVFTGEAQFFADV